MKKVLYALFVGLLFVQSGFSQESINNYKYVIVPNKYDFVKEADQYQLNSLSKFLFEKYGFKVVMQDDTYPDELYNNMCLGLKSDVVNESGLFTTKLKVVLKNCQNRVVFEGAEGTSKDKQYKVAYNQALREAFISVEALNYSYEPSSSMAQAKAVAPVAVSNEVKAPVKQVAEVATVETVTAPQPKTVVEQNEVAYEMLYAQKIAGGYQLVDSTPKVVMVLLETPKADMFLVKGRDAIVYKSNDEWILSDKSSGESKTTTLVIKF